MSLKSREKPKSKVAMKRMTFFLVFLLVVILFLVFTNDALRKYQKAQRENARVITVSSLSNKIESVKTEFGEYPDAVFFTENSALICPKIDCLIELEMQLIGSSKAISDTSSRTDGSRTKYGYEKNKDGFSLGFCDEDGNIRNFGNSATKILINCN